MTLALQILIASSIFCVVIVALLLAQKNDYLQHKFFTILMLLSSMFFLIAASAFFYSEYSSYLDRKERYGTIFKVDKINEYKFTALEIDVLEEFSEAKNILIGYEQFLEKSARNYNPDDFSYENLLKEQLISQFEQKEYTLEYWINIEHTIDNAYGKITFYTWTKFPIAIIPNNEDEEKELPSWVDSATDSEYIQFNSNLTYIERKIKSFNRSSERIKDLWGKNKIFIYTILTKSKYNKIAKTINDLIAVHDRIIQEPNYKEFYANHNLWTDEGYYNDSFLNFPSKEFVDSYNNHWLFGFWDRRFAENNDQTVYKILKEIQTHYND